MLHVREPQKMVHHRYNPELIESLNSKALKMKLRPEGPEVNFRFKKCEEVTRITPKLHIDAGIVSVRALSSGS